MPKWESFEECRDDLAMISAAIGNYHNRRGGPVYGRDKQGNWHKLYRAKSVKGIPYGYDIDNKEIVLRAAEVRSESTNT